MGMISSLKNWLDKTFKKHKNIENVMLNEPAKNELAEDFLKDIKSQVQDPLSLEGKEEKEIVMQLLQEKGLRSEFADNPRAVNEIMNAFKEVFENFDFGNKEDIKRFRETDLPENIQIHDNGLNIYKNPNLMNKETTGLNQDMISFESKNFLIKDEKFICSEVKNTVYKDTNNAKLDFSFNSVQKEYNSDGIEMKRIVQDGYRDGEDIRSVGYNDSFSNIEDAKKLGLYTSKNQDYFDKETTITREGIGTCRAVSKSKNEVNIESKHALLRSDRNISDLDDVINDRAVLDLNSIETLEGKNDYIKSETNKLLKNSDKDPYIKGVEKMAARQGYEVEQINQRD